MTRDKAKELGIKPMGRSISWANGGVDGITMVSGSHPAIKKALKKPTLPCDQTSSCIELNESFVLKSTPASGSWASTHGQWQTSSAEDLPGHPYGCTGARLVTTALYQMNGFCLRPSRIHVHRRWYGSRRIIECEA
jgi:acetyl-CoA acetyltransferase